MLLPRPRKPRARVAGALWPARVLWLAGILLLAFIDWSAALVLEVGRARTAILVLVTLAFACATLVLLVVAERRRVQAQAAQAALAQALRDVEVARREAESASQAKARFLAHMSHELRTPMNGVLGMARLLADSPLNETQRRQADGLLQSGQGLLHIISDVLDFSTIKAGRLRLDPHEMPVREVLDASVVAIAVLAHAKGLPVVRNVAADVPKWWFGDPFRLRQVLDNLLGNALKFCDSGEISLDVSVRAGACLRIEVRDTGVGIAAENWPQLFQPFSQLDESPTRRFPGTGLGLAISRELVDAMGGTMGMASELGRGSTFWVELPLPSEVATGVNRAPPLPKVPVGRVLLALGHVGSRASVAGLLRAWSVTVVEATDWQEALRSSEVPFDAVLADETSLGDQRPDVPLILVLHVATADAVSRRQAVGARAVLTLPVEEGNLAACLQIDEPPTAIVPAADPQEITQAVPIQAQVLVVDDDPVGGAVAVAMLQRLGMATLLVTDGRAAVQAARDQRFAAVLMDCHMPLMDGFAAARAIRAEESGVRVPILALTASVTAQDEAACRAAGMDDFLTKPLDFEQLRRLVVRHAGAGPDVA